MSKSNHVRGVIELFCKVLLENKVSHLRAETLRQAKFNNELAIEPLWELLHDIICYCDGKSPNGKECRVTFNKTAAAVERVKSQLQKWGYLNPGLSQLPVDMSYGSRQLLLAVGWVVHSQKLFDQVISKRTNPLYQHLLTFIETRSKTPELEKSPPESHRSTVSSKEELQKQLVLCGKLQLSLRRLFAVQQEMAKITRSVHMYTKGVNLQPELDHLTTLEVYLLRHPGAMKHMLEELEQDNEQLKHLLDWKDKEHIFWQWLDSVLDLSIQEGDPQQTLLSLEEEELVYLPVPSTIGRDIDAARTELREAILKHEEDIERMEQIVFRKSQKVSQVEREVTTMLMDRDLVQLSSRLASCGIGPTLSAGASTLLAEESQQEQSAEEEAAPLSSSRFKFQLQSERSIKAGKLNILTNAVNKKTEALRERVEDLEETLRQMQLQNLEQLQQLVNQNTDVICILPRHFKGLLNT
ncbi:tubulin epsilon and delta complex protein 1 isoform X1 [Aplysia californica]|uniref:Tubulin epsilon and delta complex protein 1 isoform X1 n=1 Tax=Aplysia californica TaxID=6500 RepID=A0ABM0JIP6_APLCA|nr:tubulin epsilon and delta complex protein 1 isoform X1 [Aplysia californica]